MKILFHLLIISLSISLYSCKPQSKVVSFTNEKIHFERYNTYQIINYKKGKQKISQQGEIFTEKLKSGIHEEMTSRKYEESAIPDIIVRYEMVSSIQVRTSSNYNDAYNDPYSRNYQYNNPSNNTSKQLEGILLIELKDRISKKLIWQASLDLKYSKKSEKNQDLLISAIQSIFQEYMYEAGNENSVEIEAK